MPDMRHVEQPGRDGRPGTSARPPSAAPSDPDPVRARPSRSPASATRDGRVCRSASASWTGSWAAVSSRVRSSSSAASRASASPPCCSRRSRAWPWAGRSPGRALRDRRGVGRSGPPSGGPARAAGGPRPASASASLPSTRSGASSRPPGGPAGASWSSTRSRPRRSTSSTGRPGASARSARPTLRLMAFAKGEGTAVILAGHVTKDGTIAGPKTLEHLVDAVINLEGERYAALRLLRASKNRFGSTEEVGVFEMGDAGLIEVTDPGRAFLVDHADPAPGSVVAPRSRGVVRCWSRSRRSSRRRVSVRPSGGRVVSIRTASACSSRSSVDARVSVSPGTTSTRTSPAVCPSRSRGWTCRSRSRSPRPCETAPSFPAPSRSARSGCSVSCVRSAGSSGGFARPLGWGSCGRSCRGPVAVTARPRSPGWRSSVAATLAEAIAVALGSGSSPRGEAVAAMLG